MCVCVSEYEIIDSGLGRLNIQLAYYPLMTVMGSVCLQVAHYCEPAICNNVQKIVSYSQQAFRSDEVNAEKTPEEVKQLAGVRP